MGRTRRAKSRRKTRRGGKIVAQGHYASILDPPIPCKDGRDMSKYVTRISKRETYDDIISKDHPALIRKLKELDPDQKYFYYPEYCEPGLLTQDNKYDGVGYKNKKYSEIVLKGSDVWNPELRKTRSWDAFFKGKSKGKKVVTARSQEQIKHLNEALNLLHKNRIVHGDLHGKNIIIADDGLPRIIDFGHTVLDAPDRMISKEREMYDFSMPTLDMSWFLSR